MLKPNKLGTKHFLSSADLTKDEIIHIYDLALAFKNKDLNEDIYQRYELYRRETIRMIDIIDASLSINSAKDLEIAGLKQELKTIYNDYTKKKNFWDKFFIY